ncbi:CCA tRNA nucleotidyltransferase 1, mitochondrial-like [Ornithodoros turicata]|uniref:CCA tRNA nucleotidyltransferase 1, mitochondrial-like n=1 Tax=Ornithodoros turicata TaxID=34597 RepID=UPI003139175B
MLFNQRQAFRNITHVFVRFFFNSNKPQLCCKKLPNTMKLDTPQFRALFSPEVKELVEIFKRHGHELRIAGGAVRDLLMHKQPQDLDFATTATPTQMKEMFDNESVRMINTKGEKHGTITARINDKANFEVTTLRIDVVTDGRHAEVEFTTDWETDANRRDLTINALFLGLDGTVYDYFHGIEDLEKRRVAFVGDPAQRIREDYLRILRYFRFYGRIAVEPDSHDPGILTAIRENVGGLAGISGERLWTELKKILAGNYSKELVGRIIDLGIAPFLGLPDSPDWNQFEKVCRRSHGLALQPVPLLTALLKDESEVMKLHSRLKFSSYERDLALFIVQHRENKEDASLKPYQRLLFVTKGKTGDVQEWICELLKYGGHRELLESFRCWDMPKFPVNGTMLLERGMRSGPKFAAVLGKLKELWFDSDFSLTTEELLAKLPDVLRDAKVGKNG